MLNMLTTIQANLEEVNQRIEKAALTSNRNPNKIKLMVVTKAQPVEVVRAVIEAGISRLGENYPEETLLKIEALAQYSHVEWHMIGHLQSRKGSIVAEHFAMLHSLDSLRLAVKLNRSLEERNRLLPVLLEFNVSGETEKFGWAAWDPEQWQNLLPEIEQVISLPNLRIEGLMTMPPLFEDAQMARPYFKKLTVLRDYLAKNLPQANWRELSMGTSADFEVAIQEGATYIRVGQAILGQRPPKHTTST